VYTVQYVVYQAASGHSAPAIITTIVTTHAAADGNETAAYKDNKR